MTSGLKIDVYLPDLSGGGAERLHVALVPELASAGNDVRFLLNRLGGDLLNQLPGDRKVISLNASRQFSALQRLIQHLRSDTPDVLVVNMEHMTITALVAKMIARVKTRIIAIQHNTLSEQAKRPSLKFRALPLLFRFLLPYADRVVAVSAGVADDLSVTCGLDRAKVSVIYNGVIDRDFARRMAQTPPHPWFADHDVPVIVAVGRMVEQKDFATLIRAFARVRQRTAARLLILGEGPLRNQLETLVSELGIRDDVAMPGFVQNPLSYMKAASLLVMSSQFEGFGNVLVEALACGTPVVSTDCPHGPAEILERGKFGELVACGDSEAMANAVCRALSGRRDQDSLRERGLSFSVETCAQSYLSLFREAAAA
jgi:glycosyltransferase involved in cell wall biosynthesis